MDRQPPGSEPVPPGPPAQKNPLPPGPPAQNPLPGPPPHGAGTPGEVADPQAQTSPYPPLPLPGSGQGPVLVVRLLGLGLALALIGFGAFGVITVFFRQSEQQSGVFAGPVRRVVAETDIGDITVHRAEPGQDLVIRRTTGWSFRRPETEVVNTAGVVTVTGRCNTAAVSFGDCSVDLDITLPQEVAVQVSTGTGDIRADGVSGEFTANTGTGDVQLRDLRSPQVNAATGTGDLMVTMVTAPESVLARTSTGDLRITVPDDGASYRVSARASVGDRVIRVPTNPASPRTITASTSVGDLTLNIASPPAATSL